MSLFSQSSPAIHCITNFRSSKKALNSERTKNQYCYRIMIMISGVATLVMNEKSFCLKSGGAVYLLPDTPYRILNTDGDFEVVNLWFDFFGSKKAAAKSYGSTLFQSDLKKELFEERYNFTDEIRLNDSFVAESPLLNDYARLVLRETQRVADERTNEICNRLLFCILSELCREPLPQNRYKERYAEIVAFIRENPSERLTADFLSEKFHYHQNHINRILKLETGDNLKQFILKCKLDSAERMKEETNMRLCEIAESLGFYDESHFLKTYKRLKGRKFN